MFTCSIVLSYVAFFVDNYVINEYLDDAFILYVVQVYCASKCPDDQPYHHHETMLDGSLYSTCSSKPYSAPPSLGVHEAT